MLPPDSKKPLPHQAEGNPDRIVAASVLSEYAHQTAPPARYNPGFRHDDGWGRTWRTPFWSPEGRDSLDRICAIACSRMVSV